MINLARAASAALVVALSGTAHASSEQAWEKFAKEVEQKCSEAASDTFRKPQVAVDPTGTDSYGVAIVYGRVKGGGKDRAALLCVVDKRSGKVEIGSELGQDVVRVRRPKQDDAEKAQKPETKTNTRQQAKQNDTETDGGATGGDDLDMGDE
jgi:hypothetical protein